MLSPCCTLQGLAALSYFVADGRYAAGDKPESAAEEFNELVKGLHARGLEVLMQVLLEMPFGLFALCVIIVSTSLLVSMMGTSVRIGCMHKHVFILF